MEKSGPIIGFLGFGEVGACLAGELAGHGARVRALVRRPERVAEKAETLGVVLVDDMAALTADADLVLSCVWPGAAAEVAAACASTLRPHQIYCDLNNISPITVAAVSRALAASEAGFVKIAIMAAVAELGARAPLLAGGIAAERVTEILGGLGLRASVLGPDPRQPAALKILRAVTLKGIVALLIETLLAAEEYGIAETVYDATMAEIERAPFSRTANGYLVSTAVHARRRAEEMNEAIDALEEAHVPAIMARAVQEWLLAVAEANVDRALGGKAPPSYRELLAALRAAAEKAS